MKLTKYVVATMWRGNIVDKKYYKTKEEAMEFIGTHQNEAMPEKYLGEEEIDLYCEGCDKELHAGDEYIKEDEHTRWCPDCYEEQIVTYYSVGGEPIGTSEEIEEFDYIWTEV